MATGKVNGSNVILPYTFTGRTIAVPDGRPGAVAGARIAYVTIPYLMPNDTYSVGISSIVQPGIATEDASTAYAMQKSVNSFMVYFQAMYDSYKNCPVNITVTIS